MRAGYRQSTGTGLCVWRTGGRRLMQRWLTGLAAAATLACAPAFAAELDLLAQGSRIGITFRQMNVPVEAEFRRFEVAGRFDAGQPQAAQAEVAIDTTSFDFGPGAEDYNSEAQGSDWLNAAEHPRALLTLGGATRTGEGSFLADGELTLRGVSHPVQVPFTLVQEGDVRVFSGEVTIQRLAFGVGAGDWADTSIVEDDVRVSFTLRSR